MKKHKDILKFGILALLAICLVTGTITGTYAKYTSTKESTDTVTVAKWSFNVNDEDIAKENFNFNLFEDSDIVAPGDTGSFTFELENTSEVNAKYNIDFEVTNGDSIPIEYSTDGGKSWYLEIDPVEDKNIASSGTDTYTVMWRWRTASDIEDTIFGTKTVLSTVTVKASVTATQVI